MEKALFGLENSIGYLLMRSGRVMAKSLRDQFTEHYPEIPVEHWGILIHLWKKDGRTQQELANCVFKDKGTITRALALLERLNIIVKVPDEKDKRNKKVFLTHRGKMLEEELTPLALSNSAVALKGLTEEEIENCKKVLEKIYTNLNY